MKQEIESNKRYIDKLQNYLHGINDKILSIEKRFSWVTQPQHSRHRTSNSN